MNAYKTLFINALLVLLVFHDYLFLNIFSVFGSYFFLNLWKEVLVSAYLIYAFSLRPLSSVSGKAIFSKKVILLSLVSLSMLLLWGDYSESSIKTFRSLVMPIFISFVIVGLLHQGTEYRCLKLFKFSCILFFISSLYGVYQSFTIDSISGFWYYDLLVNHGFELNEWDSFRGGKVRISSFFTSSLDFSFFIVLGLVSYIAYFYFFAKTISKTLIWGGGVIFLFFVILISTVRTAQISLVLCIINFIFIMFWKNNSHVFWFGLLSSLCLTAFTFYYLSAGYSDELSALGRIMQWKEVFYLVLSHPMGMGLGYIGPSEEIWYDSFLLNCFSTIGVFSFVIVAFIVGLYRSIVKIYTCFILTTYQRMLGLILLVFFPSFLYIIFFQAIYNSQVLYFFSIYISLFYFSIKVNSLIKKNKVVG